MTRSFVVALCGAGDMPYESFVVHGPNDVTNGQLRQIIEEVRGIPVQAQHWRDGNGQDIDECIRQIIWMQVDTHCHLPLPPALQDCIRFNRASVLLKAENKQLRQRIERLRAVYTNKKMATLPDTGRILLNLT